MRSPLVAVMGVLAGCALYAQVAVEPAALDIVVDDAALRGVPLRAEDFEVREAGAVLQVQQLRLIQPSTNRSPLPPIATDAEEEAVAREAARIVAVYVDEYHLEDGDAFIAAKRAVSDFLRTSLGPRDLVVVLKPLDSIVAIRLGTDRERAATIVADAAARRGDYTARTAFEQDFVAGAPARIDATRNQIVLSGIGALAAHLGRFPGRKTLIVLSDGLPAQPSPVRTGSVRSGIDTVIRAANRAGVAVYPVRPAAVAGTPRVRAAGTEAADQTLVSLAEQTTGFTVDGVAALASGLPRLLADASRYYELTVLPPAGTAEGRFRPLDVSVRRPGVVVRARAGFAPRDAEAADRGPLVRPLPAGLRVPRHTSPLIRAWFGQSRDAQGQTRVDFVWEPAVHRPGDRTTQPTPARVALTVTTMDGAPIFSGEARPAGAQAGPGSTVRSRLAFSAGPAQLLVQMDILDLAGRVLDHDARDLVVGGFPGPVSLGTAAVFRARTSLDLRALDDADATPVASRQFSRAEYLVVRIPVITGEAEPVVSARLLSGFGAPLRTLDVRALAADARVVQVTMPLSSLASAAYAVEFTARTPGGAAVGRVEFTVTP